LAALVGEGGEAVNNYQPFENLKRLLSGKAKTDCTNNNTKC
jgi:hypothetical protein